PPVTRSNSAIPVSTRGACGVSPESGESSKTRPLRTVRAAGPAATPAVPISSARVFHSPQASPRPCQREERAPPFWQTNWAQARAMVWFCWKEALVGQVRPDIGAMVAVAEPGQEFIADRAGMMGDLIDGHIRPDQFDPVAALRAGYGGDID